MLACKMTPVDHARAGHRRKRNSVGSYVALPKPRIAARTGGTNMNPTVKATPFPKFLAIS
jgi:hypothetical protein